MVAVSLSSTKKVLSPVNNHKIIENVAKKAIKYFILR